MWHFSEAVTPLGKSGASHFRPESFSSSSLTRARGLRVDCALFVVGPRRRFVFRHNSPIFLSETKRWSLSINAHAFLSDQSFFSVFLLHAVACTLVFSAPSQVFRVSHSFSFLIVSLCRQQPPSCTLERAGNRFFVCLRAN